MNELEKSFDTAKLAKEQTAEQAETLESQAESFFSLLKEELAETIEKMNGNPRMQKLARGLMKIIDNEDGYIIYVSETDLHVTIKEDPGKHISADHYKKEDSGFEIKARLIKSETFVYELDSFYVLQLRTKDGLVFQNELQLAIHILEPFWKLTD